MIINTVKTIMLFMVLSFLLIYACRLVSQNYGLFLGIFLSILLNGLIYFYSDDYVLSMYQAQPLQRHRYERIYHDVETLTKQMGLPMPKLWLAHMPIANALTIGRSPEYASVIVTNRLLEIIEPHELRGVLAHELSHIKHRDTLLGTVATTMAGVVGYIGYMVRRSSLMFSDSPEHEQRSYLADFVLSLILPVGATLVRLAISRSREFDADAAGAYYSQDPLALASALQAIEASTQERASYSPLHHPVEYMTETLFIVSPFTTKNIFMKLFSTHPPVEERVKKLKEIYKEMMQQKKV